MLRLPTMRARSDDVQPTRGSAQQTVDRLTFGGNIIETGTASQRLAHARAASRPAPST